ncbi:MAG: hypothetical protein CSA50_03510 [Gammaproteobacteria bacterium]|nr:MAG: hypothetical protein CSA50_03510 [Gammaproteobacteria bacterium]
MNKTGIGIKRSVDSYLFDGSDFFRVINSPVTSGITGGSMSLFALLDNRTQESDVYEGDDM